MDSDIENLGSLSANPTQDQRAGTRDACMTGEAVRRSTGAPHPLSKGDILYWTAMCTLKSSKTLDVYPMLSLCWPTVYDAGPT